MQHTRAISTREAHMDFFPPAANSGHTSQTLPIIDSLWWLSGVLLENDHVDMLYVALQNIQGV